MPPTLTYPGIYISEVPSPVHTIAAVPTAVAAFVGRARRGPVNHPVRIHSTADFERTFGPLWTASELGYAVQHYFTNGGSDSYVVRVVDAATAALASSGIDVPTSGAALHVTAKNPGTWFTSVGIVIDHNTRKVGSPPATIPSEFNLTVTLRETDPVSGAPIVTTESYRNVSFDPAAPQYLKAVIAAESELVTISDPLPALADVPTDNPPPAAPYSYATHPSGPAPSDGGALETTAIVPLGGVASKQGIYALENADIFTLLVIPPHSPNEGVAPDRWNGGAPHADLNWSTVAAYCHGRHAVALVDPLSTWTTEALALADITAGVLDTQVRADNTALYFPWISYADPLQPGGPRLFSPAATAAGVMARIDGNRGVWKSAAGEEAKIVGAQGLSYRLTDLENGDLNPLGINCLRTFPIIGSVLWGARTLFGADSQASEWKYLAVRRTAFMIEESLYRGTNWVVFEPNDEPLWAQIRLNVGSFMRSLFRQGAFQGATPKDAYFVKCDADTTTPRDQDLGVVNILVGFAPLKPAEFVVIKISQIAGQIAT